MRCLPVSALLLLGVCLNAPQSSLGGSVVKRDDNADLQMLLEAIQRENEAYKDTEKQEDKNRDTGMQSERGSKDGYLAEQEYKHLDDVFVDVRWAPIYADPSYGRTGRVMNGVTADQQNRIVALTNKQRAQEGSSNMEMIRWDPKIAALAQTWSQRCVFEHGQPPFSASDIGYSTLGQNIFAHTDPTFDVEMAINAWYAEKKDHNYDSGSCSASMCGHYTATVWAQTTSIGCGITFCPSISGMTKAEFIVCNYAPAGNFAGQKPFLKGAACTQCDSGKFYCNNGLCDSQCTSAGPNCQCKAACKRCSTQTSSCGCQCLPGSTGPDCSANCADIDPKCNQNPGLPPMLCTSTDASWQFVKKSCPLMCGGCKPSDGKPCNQRNGMSELKRLMLGYLEKNLNDD